VIKFALSLVWLCVLCSDNRNFIRNLNLSTFVTQLENITSTRCIMVLSQWNIFF